MCKMRTVAQGPVQVNCPKKSKPGNPFILVFSQYNLVYCQGIFYSCRQVASWQGFSEYKVVDHGITSLVERVNFERRTLVDKWRNANQQGKDTVCRLCALDHKISNE
jgi:hypothetical protein